MATRMDGKASSKSTSRMMRLSTLPPAIADRMQHRHGMARTPHFNGVVQFDRGKRLHVEIHVHVAPANNLDIHLRVVGQNNWTIRQRMRRNRYEHKTLQLRMQDRS